MYKIIDVLHSGSLGDRGTRRIDGRYPKRIGRTVTDETVENSRIGYQLILQYITDENGNDYSDMFLCCSLLKNIKAEENKIYLETQNTIYILEKINV